MALQAVGLRRPVPDVALVAVEVDRDGRSGSRSGGRSSHPSPSRAARLMPSSNLQSFSSLLFPSHPFLSRPARARRQARPGFSSPVPGRTVGAAADSDSPAAAPSVRRAPPRPHRCRRRVCAAGARPQPKRLAARTTSVPAARAPPYRAPPSAFSSLAAPQGPFLNPTRPPIQGHTDRVWPRHEPSPPPPAAPGAAALPHHHPPPPIRHPPTSPRRPIIRHPQNIQHNSHPHSIMKPASGFPEAGFSFVGLSFDASDVSERRDGEKVQREGSESSVRTFRHRTPPAGPPAEHWSLLRPGPDRQVLRPFRPFLPSRPSPASPGLLRRSSLAPPWSRGRGRNPSARQRPQNEYRTLAFTIVLARSSGPKP